MPSDLRPQAISFSTRFPDNLMIAGVRFDTTEAQRPWLLELTGPTGTREITVLPSKEDLSSESCGCGFAEVWLTRLDLTSVGATPR